MTLEELSIIHKKIDEILVSYVNFRGVIEDIPLRIENLYIQCKDFISGSPIAVIDYGVYSEGGKDIDVCYPISKQRDAKKIKIKNLEEVEVLSKIHKGSFDTINESFQQLFGYLRIHGITGTSWLRLVYHKYDKINQDNNEIEIQAVLHKWDDRLKRNLDRVLGEKVSDEVLDGRENLFTCESSMDNRAQWIKNVIARIDNVANNNEKYEILSKCAHDFSQKRIDNLKAIYERTKDIDEVIKEMHKDYAWYENPIRKGNIIYVSKIPYNQEGYKNAESTEEKRRNYCHCPLVRNYFNIGISPTFCNCSTGWYRQQWEGILGKPIQIEVLKSLVKGDDYCEFAIYLPSDIK
ncbi:MAG: hypothetical protein ACFFA6_13810 [Promethearchaeota archaeon]